MKETLDVRVILKDGREWVETLSLADVFVFQYHGETDYAIYPIRIDINRDDLVDVVPVVMPLGDKWAIHVECTLGARSGPSRIFREVK